MTYRAYSVIYRLRFVFGSILVLAALLLLTFALSVMEGNTAEAKAPATSTEVMPLGLADSPNVITSGMYRAADEAGEAMDTAAYAVTSSAQTVASATSRGAKVVAHGVAIGATTTARAIGKSAAFVGNAAWSGATFVGRAVGGGVLFVIGIPADIAGFVSQTSMVQSVIKPADIEQIPIIDPNSPELLAALAALPAEEKDTKTAPSGKGPIWPIHGEITAAFGVPHRPYQPIHTGIDISDHRRAGVTRVKPFRPGRVIDVVYSRYGFGNHVIVDHGNGVTSLYGHLDSIAVKVGQKVDLTTTLGREGTTGLSTGVHLHFEIRVNGQAADPRKFISGRP